MSSNEFQVRLITGLSDPLCWELTPSQIHFLDSLELPKSEVCYLNFPYRLNSTNYKPVPLWLASIRNYQSFNAASRESFKVQHQDSMFEMISQNHHTLFIAGSCGLELLNNLDLPSDGVSVFAYGPVCKHAPRYKTMTVQSRSDVISRWYFKKADHTVSGGHMSYLSNPKVLELCKAFIHATKQNLGLPTKDGQ